MRQLDGAWNQNMAQQFLPSQVNVIDEYMMEWLNNWAPGFMFLVCKLHIFGNERDTNFFDIASILWISQIVEGNENPTQLGLKK